ncbi:MAG: EscU/YscU/HrcU family type III secretion system export apparatus switch protein [Methylococcales bacterium]
MSKTFNKADTAVALHYDRKNAPKITAKGKGEIANQIIEKAKQHGIPMQADPVLAKTLSKIPLGQEIPAALYTAVAEVIAFAYMLTDKHPDDDI